MDILKRAYRNHDRIATLTDGRMVCRQDEKRHNSCGGCVFAHEKNCFCEADEIWKQIK